MTWELLVGCSLFEVGWVESYLFLWGGGVSWDLGIRG